MSQGRKKWSMAKHPGAQKWMGDPCYNTWTYNAEVTVVYVQWTQESSKDDGYGSLAFDAAN